MRTKLRKGLFVVGLTIVASMALKEPSNVSANQEDAFEIVWNGASLKGDEGNYNWFVEGGTLKIQGTGEMGDFLDHTDNNPPWYDHRKEITQVEISEGITKIGRGAFYEFENLKEISIPDSVTIIADIAFSHSGLTKVTIPDNVVSIGEQAFYENANLTEIEFGENVESIGGRALSRTGLKTVKLPEKLTIVESGLFEMCEDLEQVIFNDGLKEIKDYAFYHTILQSADLPNTVESIGRNAFDSTKLNSLKTPQNLKVIDFNAFIACDNLSTVTLNEGLKYLGDDSFKWCPITEITLPASMEECIFALDMCTELEHINVSKENPIFYSQDGVLFRYDNNQMELYPVAKKDTSYSIPEGTKSLGYKCFSRYLPNLKNLEEIIIPHSVTWIPEYTFESLPQDISVYYKGTEEEWKQIYDDYGSPYSDISERVIFLGNEGDSDNEKLEDELKKAYISEHIEFSESQDYKDWITPEWTTYLSRVLRDIKEDGYVKGYDILKTVNKVLKLEYDITFNDESEMYEMLLGELLYGMQEDMAEVYQDNYTQRIVESCKIVSEGLSIGDNAVELKELVEKLQKSRGMSEEFRNVLSEFSKNIKDIPPSTITEMFIDNTLVIEVGIDFFEKNFKAADEVIQYIASGCAYLDTSEYFNEMMLRMIYYCNNGRLDFPHGDESDTLETFKNLCALQEAVVNFCGKLTDYKTEGAQAVATYARNEFVEANGQFLGESLKKIGLVGAKTIMSQIPILREFKALSDLLSAGQTLIDIATHLDDRSYNASLVKMCYYISYPLYLVVDDYKIELNSNDFKSAVKFDYSINAYKTLTRIAAKYGSNYEEGVLKDTIIGKEDDVKRKRSHCSTAIHLMESIRILYKNLQCHSTNLIYDHKTDSITYKSDDLMCYTVACPVNVIVETDTGEKIAELSGENSYIKQGYEKYFFVVENGEEDIKIAVVPSNYKVTLKGTDIGTMDVVTNNIVSGNVENPKGFYNIPVTSTTEGYFDQSTDTLVVDNKIYTEDTVDHQHSYDSPKFDWSEDLSMCTAQFTCNACHFTQKLECTVENLLDVMDANTQITRHVRKAKVEVDGRIYEDVKTKVIYPSGETIIQSDGWVSVGDNNWKYIYMGQEVVSNWISITEADPYNNNEVGEVWYHFGADGLMQRGWIVDETGWKVYLLDSNGRMMHSDWVNAPKNTELNRPAGIYHLTDDGAVQMNGWALAKNSQTVYWYCNPGTGLFEKNNPGSWSGKKLW